MNKAENHLDPSLEVTTEEQPLHSGASAESGERKRNNPKQIAGKVIILIVLILYLFSLFFPLYTVLITSFTTTAELSSTTSFIWFPKNFTFVNYARVFTEDIWKDELGAPTLLVGFLNTMWMSLIPLIVGLIVSGLSAFAYTKIQFPGRERLFRFAFILSTIPLGAFGIISYTFYALLGWTGTPLPLIVPGLFGGMGTVFFLKMYYEGISDSIVEAARIDGLSTIGIFFKIMFPLAIPAFIAQFIFGFVGKYNAYLGPLLYLQDHKFFTLQLVLANTESLFPKQENVHCAAAILGMLPLIVIYAFSQKLFIEGVAVGGVKG